jgi:hypothetical protein
MSGGTEGDHENLRIGGIPAKTGTGNLLITTQECYSLIQLMPLTVLKCLVGTRWSPARQYDH